MVFTKLVVFVLGFSLVFAASPEEYAGEFEGDIKLTPSQKYAIENGLDLEPANTFGASKSKRWSKGVFPYVIDSSLNGAKGVLDSAMREWSQKTCIRFVPRTNQREYVEFFRGGGCWSYVGMTGGKQKISLAGGCWYHGTVVHEIGHALGFWHEQSRPDRDEYVTIMWDNIPSGNRHNFNKYTKTQIDSLNVPYDYGSIMHYGRRAFSNNGRDTIVPKKEGVTLGQRRGLSSSDVQQMNLMYNCKQGTPRPPTQRPPTPPKPDTTSPPEPTGPSNGLKVELRSEGCDDPKLVQVHCGRAYIKVNGVEYAPKTRGHNLVVVDLKTGRVEHRRAYDTHGSTYQSNLMARKLNDLANAKQRKVILVAVQDEGRTRMTSLLESAIRRVGGRSPVRPAYRGSYSLVGYSGPERPSWIRQVKNLRYRGPSKIMMVISSGPGPQTPRPPPPSTKPPGPQTSRPPVGSCGVPGGSGRVIGGTNAAPGAWPWQIALLRSGRFSCGGSLIYADWVLTAAHCVARSPSASSYTVLLGAHNRNSPQSHEQSIKAKRVIVHSQYGRPTLNNDIALIQLQRPATLNSRVSTVCLPSHNFDVPVGSTCYITGWGKIRHPGSSHHTLQQAMIPPVGQEECKRKLAQSPDGHRLSITEQMLCAGVKDSILSGCHGDSGGPYVCRDSNNRFVLQGAVSWGSPRCSSTERYTVFARVAKFRNWIDEQIRRAG